MKTSLDNEELISELLSLLDLIEVRDDATLAGGRFEILERHGHVVFTGEIVSGSSH